MLGVVNSEEISKHHFPKSFNHRIFLCFSWSIWWDLCFMEYTLVRFWLYEKKHPGFRAKGT